MKTFFLFFLLIFCFYSYSQKPFLRIYDTTGHNIANGRIFYLADSFIQLSDNIVPISYKKIGVIKTKHSTGHYIGGGALVGIFSGLLLSEIFYKPGTSFLSPDRGTVVLFGSIAGLITGTVGGIIVSVVNKRDVFIIYGSQTKWEEFIKYVSIKEKR